MKDQQLFNADNEKGAGQERVLTGPIVPFALLHDVPYRSGKELLTMMRSCDKPQELVQSLSCQDYYWLIKKLDESDIIPVLSMASLEQWQHILDIEVWKGGRLEGDAAFSWISRFREADATRLSEWLLCDVEGRYLAPFVLSKLLDIVIADEENIAELPEGFFTIDNTFYLNAIDPENHETLEKLLRAMASYDMHHYQDLLAGTPAIIPYELEEEMYRLRNFRIAEQGFVPREEALIVYDPLEPESLTAGTCRASVVEVDPEIHKIPMLPFIQAEGENRTIATMAAIPDPALRDRIYLEFAGLCNMIVSAEGRYLSGLDDLRALGKKAAGYLHLAREMVCGSDAQLTEQLVRTNPLLSFFRVGFGFVLALQREAKRWISQSWFHSQGLKNYFWGDQWGEMLNGICAQPPQFYAGLVNAEPLRDFAGADELDHCRRGLNSLLLLDQLLKRLTEICILEDSDSAQNNLTFYHLLFHFWVREILGDKPSFSALSIGQVKKFFRLVRGRSAKPPYLMKGWESIFADQLSRYIAPELEDEATDMLRKVLSGIWGEFRDEYAEVPSRTIDCRYAKFISVRSC